LSAKHYAGVNHLPFTVFECNPQVDEEVVQGQYMPTGVGNELEWRYSALATALGQPGVVLLNESTRMTAKSNALFLRILQERELQVSRHKNEVIKVHPECLIITDANPGYRGTMASDQAFLDRFAYRLEYNYDIEIEKHFIPSTSLLSLVADLRKQAEREDKWSTPISTRLLEAFVEHAEDLGMATATDMFIKAFPVEEREALRMLFEVNSELIADELGVTA
jgi:MoxR-like ATPase